MTCAGWSFLAQKDRTDGRTEAKKMMMMHCKMSALRRRMRNPRAAAADDISHLDQEPQQQTHRNDDDNNNNYLAIEDDDDVEAQRKAVILESPSYANRKGPPLDDRCVFCLESFSLPCQSNCGHWYCGECILRYWKYNGAYGPSKCPICSKKIRVLKLEASLHREEDQEVTIQVLEDVQRYNSICVGGVRGFLKSGSEFLRQGVLRSPFLIKRFFEEMMDPDVGVRDFHYHDFLMRMFGLFLALLYLLSPFEFIPLGDAGILKLFDYGSTILVLILYSVGTYRRRRRNQHARALATPGILLQ